MILKTSFKINFMYWNDLLLILIRKYRINLLVYVKILYWFWFYIHSTLLTRGSSELLIYFFFWWLICSRVSLSYLSSSFICSTANLKNMSLYSLKSSQDKFLKKLYDMPAQLLMSSKDIWPSWSISRLFLKFLIPSLIYWW